MTNGNESITAHLTYDTYTGAPNGFIDGLTKREYFAAMAMQGMLANSIDTSQVAKPYHHMRYEELAQNSVSAADALINALNETQQ